MQRSTTQNRDDANGRSQISAHDPMSLHVRLLLCTVLALCASLASSCSSIEFEYGPYAVQQFDIVYSQQENMTFLAWRLPKASSPDDYDFELYHEQERRFLRLDLTQAIFPAKPYTCKKNYVCFQYQIPGRYTFSSRPDAPANPIRTVHHSYGTFPGGPPRIHEAATTFGIRPIAIDNNSAFDPRRDDWFVTNDIPFTRKYEWQLVDLADSPAGSSPTAERCAEPATAQNAWAALSSKATLPNDWTSKAHCMVARPIAQGRSGTSVKTPFSPSAELVWEVQNYEPPTTTHPTLYAFLFDLQITNEQRCEAIKKTIVSTVKTSFEKTLEKRPGTATFIGTYTPISADTGEPTSGCTQRTRQDYPIAEIIDDMKLVATTFAPKLARVVFIYLNNMNLPPSGRGLEQIFELDMMFQHDPQLVPYYWAISTNIWLQSVNWDATTGWSPIEEQIFIDSLKNFAQPRIPFRTMEHDLDTPVPIYKPAGAIDPQFFKICDYTPQISGVLLPKDLFPRQLTTFKWPATELASYVVNLGAQDLVEYDDYRRQKSRIILETCQRFCDGPFRTQSGIDYDNWRQAPKTCQRSK